MKSSRTKPKHHGRRSIPRRRNRGILSTNLSRQMTSLTKKKALEVGLSRRCDPPLHLPTEPHRHTESVLLLGSVASPQKVADHPLLCLIWKNCNENALYITLK